jgi:hypothetical protein
MIKSTKIENDDNDVLCELNHTQKKEREIPKCKKLETHIELEQINKNMITPTNLLGINSNDLEDNRFGSSEPNRFGSSEPNRNIIRYNSNSTNTKEWRSCCFSINSSAAKYFVQATVLTSLITYSAVMLVVNEDCNSQRNYSSLLMMCLGILIPSPKF